MAETDYPPIAERLRLARVMSRLSQAELARRVGMQGQSSIGEIERGRSARPTKLFELARELKCSVPWLLGDEPLDGPGHPIVPHMSNEEVVDFLATNPDEPIDDDTRRRRLAKYDALEAEGSMSLAKSQLSKLRNAYYHASSRVHYNAFPETNASNAIEASLPSATPVPIFGQAEGGADGRFVLNGEQLALTFRPPSLVGVQHAYAVYVYGHSMEERFQPGDLVWVDPNKPVRQGDDVVVQIRPEATGDIPFGYVKRFVTRNGKELVLKQLNPPDGSDPIIRFPAQSVISVHKIVFVEPA